MPTEDEVGYRHPPLSTRFRPGVSGNPSGRPKRQRTLADEIAVVLNEIATIREEGRKVAVTKRRAIARELVKLAVSGDLRAASIVLSSSGKADEDFEETEPTPADCQILEHMKTRNGRRETRTRKR